MIAVGAWGPSGGVSLEPNAARAAVEVGRNLALTAGPGAGKTELLAQRADFLLRTGTCRYPRRILAISFKVDAAQNLKARVYKRCGHELARRMDSFTFHAFAKRLIDNFRVALTGANALRADYDIGPQRIQGESITFDDMIPLATEIVESSRIARNAIRMTYSHVFVDEFQDCTAAQYRLIRACFHGTATQLTAVGDTKQRIMGWAGALEGIFETFATDFGALRLNLYQNFRSMPRLRRMQNAIVRVMDPDAAVDDSELVGAEGTIELRRYKDDNDEAVELTDLIAGWIESGVEPSEIAVLVCKQQGLYCQKLRSSLEQAGIPYRDEDQSQNLAAEPVATLIVDFLLVVCGRRQPAALRRLLDLAVLSRGLDEEREYQTRSRWDRFVNSTRSRYLAGDLAIDDASSLEAIVCDLLEMVGRDAIVGLSHTYAHGDFLDRQIVGTVGHLADVLASGRDTVECLAAFAGDAAVRIMSIHKSKGLEFHTVVVLGIENETFWGGLEAERSTYFVGVSRAKQRLVLTACSARERPAGAKGIWRIGRTEQEEFIGYAVPYI